MRIVFMGTPEFAVPVLDALVQAGHEIVAVVTQPDREKDKKGNLLPTPVKRYALLHALCVMQYDRVSDHIPELAALRPDVMVTAAYGQLLRAEVLHVATLGVLNVHASLLPAWRGASPVQSCLLAGERYTGVTVMRTDVGMDTGDMLSSVSVPIEEDDNAQTLTEKLALAGARLLTDTLPPYKEGKITPVPQENDKATYCKKITKADGLIDWRLSAREIACRVRAFYPWPTAYTYLDGDLFKILAARAMDGSFGTAGEIACCGDEPIVACGEGGLQLVRVQAAGKKAMTAAEFLRGKKIAQGTVLHA